MGERGAVVGDCPGRAALDLLCGKEELQQVGRVLGRRGLDVLECGSHRGLELLEPERVEQGLHVGRDDVDDDFHGAVPFL